MRKKFWRRLFRALLLLSTTCWGQEFEVASVKIATSGFDGVRGGCRGIDTRYNAEELATAPPLGRCRITDGRLSHLMGIAYGIGMGQIKDAPDWVIATNERFNVEAVAADPQTVTEAELLRMLQNLLASRFELKFHRETKEREGLAVSLGKGAPKIRESHVETCRINPPGGKKRDGPMTLVVQGCPVARVMSILPAFIVDETGLTGIYDFKLEWDESQGPTLVTAIREQLGLRVETKNVPYQYFVIESAKRPSAN
jgi:uncharacterized protein (TIGR03435 family)